MNKLENIVPPLELCKFIPAGEFEESALVWRDIPGFSNYQVSNNGKVRSKNYNRKGIMKELSLYHDKSGYMRVGLTVSGKSRGYLVHQLVALAFIENTKGYKEVDHINTIPDDNRVCNLRWCSSRENKLNPITRFRNSINNHWRGRTGDKMWNSKKVRCVETGVIIWSNGRSRTINRNSP